MDPIRPSPQSMGFGVYELDLRAGELRKHGVKLKLQEKPLALLGVLLQNAGKLVTREELRQQLWSQDTFVDFDHSLSIAIHKVRQVLGDTAENPRFVETLPRRGYRFLAPVRQAADTPISSKKMVLVLPFEDLGPNPSDEYFVDGLTDEMITRLARSNPQRLGVIARTSAMRYKKSNQGLQQIADDMRVQYVLEGTVRRTRGRVRISVRLIQTKDESLVWAETYDRALKDVVLLQTEVAETTVSALSLELVPQAQAVLQKTSTKNYEAFDLYLQGRFAWNRRTEEGFKQALQWFTKALEADPEYALAHGGVADCYAVFGFYGFLPPNLAYEKAISAARRALKIEENLPEAHSALGFSILQYEWDWTTAQRHHHLAISLNPNYAPAFHWYGLNLMQLGNFHEALTSLRRAEALDPFSAAIQTQIGWLYYFSRDFSRAIQQLQNALRLDAMYPLARYFLGMALMQSGDHLTAVNELQDAVEQTQSHPACVAALAAAQKRHGRGTQAKKTVQRLVTMAKSRHVSPYFMAYALTAWGEADEIVPWLERSFDEKSGWMLYLKLEPAFDEVRSDARIANLLQRVIIL